MLHLDLFSGIGGFAYAADQVFGEVEHIFCDNDKFCQQVLEKHWPGSLIYDDIRAITNTSLAGARKNKPGVRSQRDGHSDRQQVYLLTGGFPCQPFSAAGLRRGTADDRHLWPEMLRVIRLTKPEWVIAENVRGLLSWNEGLVFQQVCLDLEAEGYGVQPLIIPAVAVNAPHRRDRIWFVGYSKYAGQHGTKDGQSLAQGSDNNQTRPDELKQPAGPSGLREDATDSGHIRQAVKELQTARDEQYSWSQDWLEVATELCGVDDGLPTELDGFKLSKSQHRKERLKSLGNAIVPQVAMEIMKGMVYDTTT